MNHIFSINIIFIQAKNYATIRGFPTVKCQVNSIRFNCPIMPGLNGPIVLNLIRITGAQRKYFESLG